MKVHFDNHPRYAPGDEIPDDKVIFVDDILYIIYGENDSEIKVKRIIILAEFEDPISLADIAKEYPDVRKVIYEEPLCGSVFNYNNHLGEGWELVGATIGYA